MSLTLASVIGTRKNLTYVQTTTSLKIALEKLLQHKIHAVPIFDEQQHKFIAFVDLLVCIKLVNNVVRISLFTLEMSIWRTKSLKEMYGDCWKWRNVSKFVI